MKDKLYEVLKNPANKLIAVDLDGTLSTGEFWGVGGEPEPEPIQKMIDYINKLYLKGAHIIIYTARNQDMYRLTQAWLIKHSVRFHGIAMQHKLGADLYIEDKALNVEDIL